MAWVNVFDVGPCEVEVYEEGPGLIPEADYAARGITVSTTGGVVSVSYDTLYGALSVRVVLQYDTGSASVRIGSFNSSGVQFNQAGILDGEMPRDFEALSGEASAYTPDPATFTAPGTWDRAFVSTWGAG